jgi:hypothetical protein
MILHRLFRLLMEELLMLTLTKQEIPVDISFACGLLSHEDWIGRKHLCLRLQPLYRKERMLCAMFYYLLCRLE